MPTATLGTVVKREGSGVEVRLRLVLASALMLFAELSLIRWLGANLVHLAYFSNFVLLGSFLGVGLGFLRASRDGLPGWHPDQLMRSAWSTTGPGVPLASVNWRTTV